LRRSVKAEPIDLSAGEETDTVEVGVILPAASVSLLPESPPRIKVIREIADASDNQGKKKQKPGKAPEQGV